MAISIDNQKTRTIKKSPDYPMEFMLGMYERPEAATSKAGSYPKEFVVDISGRASLPMATPQRTRRKILGRLGESAVNMHRWSLFSREIAALGWLLMKSTGGHIESVGLLPIERRASGHGGILVSLLLVRYVKAARQPMFTSMRSRRFRRLPPFNKQARWLRNF